MNDQNERTRAGQAAAGDSESAADEVATRTEEQGEVDEPDAPTAEEENVGMNTVLHAEPLFGVQDDASEK